MSIRLQKEVIKASEVLCAEYGQSVVEADIIVPDVKPDILKILQVDGDVCITQKSVQQDKIVIQGNVKIHVLYVPDGECIGRVKSIHTMQPFTHMTDIKGSKSNIQVFADAEVEKVEFSLINSRKLNVKIPVGINIKATAISEIDIAVDMESECSCQKKCSVIMAQNACLDMEREIVIREEVEVPAGKPALAEMLKINANIFSRELRMVDNKAVIKGDVELCSLYLGDDEYDSVNFMEHNLDFTEILDVEGVRESMDGEADYSLKEISFDVREDADGDRRMLEVEIVICVNIRASEVMEINAIEDAYALDGEVKITYGSHNIEQLVGKSSAQLSHRDMATLEPSYPEMAQVYNCVTKTLVSNVRVENGKATVEGIVHSNILYLSRDEFNPVCSLKHESKFTYTMDVPGIEDGNLCDAKAQVEHVSYNMTLDREIELRFIIAITVKAVKACMTEIIEDIEFVENGVVEPRPSIVIYFVQKGDTLWSIAKRYRSTPEAIMDTNHLTSDHLTIGQQLMI